MLRPLSPDKGREFKREVRPVERIQESLLSKSKCNLKLVR